MALIRNLGLDDLRQDYERFLPPKIASLRRNDTGHSFLHHRQLRAATEGSLRGEPRGVRRANCNSPAKTRSSLTLVSSTYGPLSRQSSGRGEGFNYSKNVVQALKIDKNRLRCRSRGIFIHPNRRRRVEGQAELRFRGSGGPALKHCEIDSSRFHLRRLAQQQERIALQERRHS
jgi:hypothetical protein